MKEVKKKNTAPAKKGLFITLTGLVSIMVITLTMNLAIRKETEQAFDVEAWDEAVEQSAEEIEELYTEEVEAVTGEVAREEESEESAPAQERETTAENAPEEASETPLVIPKSMLMEKPVDGEISKDFSGEELVYSETMHDWRVHEGVDFKATLSQEVRAAADGTVESLSEDGMFGACLTVSHPDGVQSFYGNLEIGSMPEVGTQVKTGQVIGKVGNTATAEINDVPHIHFEVRKDGKAENPHDYFGDVVAETE